MDYAELDLETKFKFINLDIELAHRQFRQDAIPFQDFEEFSRNIGLSEIFILAYMNYRDLSNYDPSVKCALAVLAKADINSVLQHKTNKSWLPTPLQLLFMSKRSLVGRRSKRRCSVETELYLSRHSDDLLYHQYDKSDSKESFCDKYLGNIDFSYEKGPSNFEPQDNPMKNYSQHALGRSLLYNGADAEKHFMPYGLNDQINLQQKEDSNLKLNIIQDQPSLLDLHPLEGKSYSFIDTDVGKEIAITSDQNNEQPTIKENTNEQQDTNKYTDSLELKSSNGQCEDDACDYMPDLDIAMSLKSIPTPLLHPDDELYKEAVNDENLGKACSKRYSATCKSSLDANKEGYEKMIDNIDFCDLKEDPIKFEQLQKSCESSMDDGRGNLLLLKDLQSKTANKEVSEISHKRKRLGSPRNSQETEIQNDIPINLGEHINDEHQMEKGCKRKRIDIFAEGSTAEKRLSLDHDIILKFDIAKLISDSRLTSQMKAPLRWQLLESAINELLNSYNLPESIDKKECIARQTMQSSSLRKDLEAYKAADNSMKLDSNFCNKKYISYIKSAKDLINALRECQMNHKNEGKYISPAQNDTNLEDINREGVQKALDKSFNCKATNGCESYDTESDKDVLLSTSTEERPTFCTESNQKKPFSKDWVKLFQEAQLTANIFTPLSDTEIAPCKSPEEEERIIPERNAAEYSPHEEWSLNNYIGGSPIYTTQTYLDDFFDDLHLHIDSDGESWTTSSKDESSKLTSEDEIREVSSKNSGSSDTTDDEPVYEPEVGELQTAGERFFQNLHKEISKLPTDREQFDTSAYKIPEFISDDECVIHQ